MDKIKLSRKRGQSLIEILVAIGLTAVLLPGLLTGFVASREGKAQEGQRLQATALLRETEEAIRSVRDASWSNISTKNGTYHPEISANAWTLVSEPQYTGQFTRSVAISDVQRDPSGNIVTSGGTVDTSSKRAVSTVSWTTPMASSISSTNYLERYKGNTAWLQTTQSDFNAGNLSSTVVTNNSGGEIQLAPGSGGNWATPTIAGNFNSGGNANGLSVFVDGNYAYLGSTNVAGGNNLSIVDISSPTTPTLTGSISFGNNITGVFVSGNYAYLATSGNTSELTIVNITNKSSPTTAATLNLGGNEDATAIHISGNYAYVAKRSGTGTNRELYVVNISNPTAPSIAGSYEAGANVNSVSVTANYAYIATDIDSSELRILNISNPASPTLTGNYNASTTANGLAIYLSGSTAYLGTANNTGAGSEFYIINVSNPSSPSLIGNYNAGNNIFGIFVSGTYAFLATDTNTQQLQVVNISTPSLPALYAFVGNDNTSSELTVILGGSGATFVTSGSFESQIFDAGTQAAFNYLTFSINEPINTNIIFQLAINNDGSTWNYFGSYESAAAIPLADINGRYIRFRATLSGNGSATPAISDVSINYSP
ncbi:MAG: hypothetical protein UU23_C0001G0103 [Candidatus Curtissbacteria bacterium GW2011_GWA1_40_9]|uniref:LVIVD repeat protein n=1 Tax=Candidatus Curtissbacteria bacterium GW2011_GWA1_40_9 TaxID=1618408 RepID=A0A0G0TMR9_9BACT|nr:MAG: hypothetical protein UU23_C0001G0103 [Candidatus Curtissbacteria bacterium GW2011_GWA1_40_9]